MYNLIMFSMVFLFLSIIMFLLNFILSKKMYKNRMMMTSFECGFDSITPNRLPFSLQFYLIALIFLIFDIEIALILPFIKMMNFKMLFLMMNFMMILIILVIGLLVEWKEGALIWFK